MNWHCYMCEEDNSKTKNMDPINTVSNLLKTAITEIDKIISNYDNNSSRRKNLIVSGIPKDNNTTNDESLVRSVADFVGFQKQYWLDNCFKLARKQSHDVMNLEKCLIKFTNEMNRDDFVKSYFDYTKKKKLKPATIGLSVNNGAYVNENLSEDLGMIMKEAILMQKKYTEESSRSLISCHGYTF